MVNKRLLTTGEIAGYCGVNFRTVIRWIERGLLKAYRLPGPSDYRIEVEGFLQFLKTHKMPIPKDLQENTQRVLIVEDDNPMANAIQRVLRKNGFETMIAPNGFRAGIMLERFTPAVITLDLKMPDLSGHEVLKLIRSMEHLALIRILVISAMSQRELDEALKAGADDVLKKPFSNEELVKKVTALSGLEERSSTQGQSLASR